VSHRETATAATIATAADSSRIPTRWRRTARNAPTGRPIRSTHSPPSGARCRSAAYAVRLPVVALARVARPLPRASAAATSGRLRWFSISATRSSVRSLSASTTPEVEIRVIR
jgi:hypothetical protein